jgi:glycosyltransferase involved in cell wall biosynthesis
MRRILYIADTLARTGLASQLLVLARGIAKRDCDVQVLTLDRRGALAGELRDAGIEVTEIGRRWRADPVAWWQLRRTVRQLRPDIMHTWGLDLATFAAVVESGRGRPIVAGHYRFDPHKNAAAWRLERRLSESVRRQVANSALIRNWYAAHGLLVSQFSVIPFGVPLNATSDVTRAQLLNEFRLPANAKLIGVVGRLVPEKRVRDLIWAADLLRVLHDNLRVLIIGDGPERPILEQYARLASDLDHIRFLGERNDLARIMPHFDVLWNADENRGHTASILEAMAAGVPVLASDTPFNRELVVENETGYLIPLGTRSGRADRARHTDRIFSDAALAARLGKAARDRAHAHFDAEHMIELHAELYASKGVAEGEPN